MSDPKKPMKPYKHPDGGEVYLDKVCQTPGCWHKKRVHSRKGCGGCGCKVSYTEI